MAGHDAVIHLAAIVGDPACKLYSDLAIKTNWETSKWLIDRCIELGISKFIFASTCSNYGKMDDPDAYVAAAKRGAAIGIEGKWAIHPSQIELANKVFSPPDTEVNKAKKILEELEKAAKEGKGAAQLDGRMIDAASARMAENIVNIDKLINNK